MQRIKGFTFRLEKGQSLSFSGEDIKESVRLLKQSTGIDTIILAIIALQDTPQSEEIDYTGSHMPTDEELTQIIHYIQEQGMRVILKPMVNCKNGVWRAHINFFDKEVPCEPKWSHWFASYYQYILHYGKIAEVTNCEMLVIGCELVQTERKETYWRGLVAELRKVYHGLLTYNTDKYQEEEVKWWDALDVISSSGYYPINAWEKNLDRIEKVVKRYKKPFFFAECGCPSRRGSSLIPNDWTHKGELDLEEQKDYYMVMFDRCSQRDWMKGYACWDWTSNMLEYDMINDGYSVFGKPACSVIRQFYNSDEERKRQ